MSDLKILNTIRGIVVSEKSERIKQGRQYVFRVAPDADKAQVRRAVKVAFSAEVDSVRICNVKPRARRFRFIAGRIAGYKKAYVRLKPGFDIDIGEES